MIKQIVTGIWMLISMTATGYAQQVFITQSFNVGLHEDRTLESPILTLVNSGAELQLIKREDDFTYVSTMDDQRGWIDNSYLTDTTPSADGVVIQDLQAQLDSARIELETLRNNPEGGVDSSMANLQNDYLDLQQAYNSEQLKAGELQVQLAELRKRVGQDNDNQSLYEEIQGLQQDKKTLEVQLAAILEREGVTTTTETGQVSSQQTNWRNTLIYFAIAVFVGFCCGIYLMDFINRRRHAGLRV